MAGKYKVLHHDESHFLMQHPNGEHFKVAKKALDNVTRNEIMKMADGGEIESPETQNETPATGVDNWTALKNSETPATRADNWTALKNSVSAIPQAMGDVRNEFQDFNPAPLIEGSPPEERGAWASLKRGLGAPDIAPKVTAASAVPPPQPAPPSAEGPAPTPGQATAAIPGPMGNTPLLPWQQQQIQGSQEQAKVEGEIGRQKAEAEAAAAQQLSKLNTDFNKFHTSANARNEQLMTDMLKPENQVNPNRYWDNKSTEGKITAIIGMALGGIGAGLSHGPNLAINAINGAIDRDIDAQKANISNKNSLFSKNLEMLRSEESATAMTKSNLTAIAAATVGKITGQNAGPQAQAISKQLTAQLVGQFDSINKDAAAKHAMSKYVSDMMGGGAGTTAPPPMNVGEIKPEQFVRLPNGQWRLANSLEDEKELRKAQENLQEINSKIQEMRRFREEHGATLGTPLYKSTADEQGTRLKNDLILNFGKLENLVRFTPEEKHLYETLVSHPGRLNADKFNSNMGDLERMVRDKLDAVYTNRLMGYKPAKGK
jgi:hypothetical protein